MYGYEEFAEVSAEQLLQKITQQQIFEFILGRPFSFEDRYTSPFRIDTKPGCRFIEREDGTILFVDFGEKAFRPHRTHRTCFAMVMDRYNVNLTKAVNIVLKYFNLSTSSQDYTEVTSTTPIKHTSSEDKFQITYSKVTINKHHERFWRQFIITPENLIEDNVFPASKFVTFNPIKGKTSVFNVFGHHCYVIDFLDAVKIYQPYSDTYKWITNCNENHIGNIDNLPATGEELIVCSSYKDHRVTRNVLDNSNVVWFMNEGCIPSRYILENLVSRFNLITIFFDSDLTGVRAARSLQIVFNDIRRNCCRVVFLPRSQVILNRYGYYLKDVGLYVHKEGRKELINVFKHIGLYGADTKQNT